MDNDAARGKVPKWWEEAVRLRKAGYTLREISREIGVTAQRIHQVLGKLAVEQDPEAVLRRRLEVGKLHRCRGCDAITRHKDGYCPDCLDRQRREERERGRAERRRKWEQRWARLEKLWAEGLTARQIADELGVGEGYIQQLVIRGRKIGRSFPHRREPWRPKKNDDDEPPED